MKSKNSSMTVYSYAKPAMVGIALLIANCFSPAYAKDSKKLYCWNNQGARTCSDTLPSNAVNDAHDVINEDNGMRQATLNRALTPEEIKAKDLAEQQQEARQAELTAQQKADQLLLSTYPTEADLQRSFQGRQLQISNNLDSAALNIHALRAQLVFFLQNASNQELMNRPISIQLAQSIQKSHTDLVTELHAQAGFAAQNIALRNEIDASLAHYHMLKQHSDGSAPNTAPPP